MNAISATLLALLLCWCVSTLAVAKTDKPLLTENTATETGIQSMNTCPQSVPAAPFMPPAPGYQRHYHTIAHQFLDDEQEVSHVTVDMVAILDTLIAEAVATLPPYPRGLQKEASHLRRDSVQGLTVRPEPVEGWAVKPIMVRQALGNCSMRCPTSSIHAVDHERLLYPLGYNLKLSRLKLDAQKDKALAFAVQALNQIDCILLRHGFVYPGRGTVQLLSDGLAPTRFAKFRYLNDVYRHPHNIRRRAFVKARGFGPFYVVDCDIAAYLYVAIGQVLGYPLHLIDIPNHIFVRWELGEGRFINYETMDGLVTDDRYYRQKWQIPDALVQQGGILRSMTVVEAKAYHDASVAEAWSWQQAYQATRDGYLRAVQHDATRPFALNNLAWFYIAAPLPQADNAAMAIKYARLAAKVFPSGDNFDTLACAYAQAQDFTRALNTAKQAARINYAPFESDIAGHIKRFEQKRGCDTAEFGRELKPFRSPEESDRR